MDLLCCCCACYRTYVLTTSRKESRERNSSKIVLRLYSHLQGRIRLPFSWILGTEMKQIKMNHFLTHAYFIQLFGSLLQYIKYIVANHKSFTTCFDICWPLGTLERHLSQINQHHTTTFGTHKATNNRHVLFQPIDARIVWFLSNYKQDASKIIQLEGKSAVTSWV